MKLALHNTRAQTGDKLMAPAKEDEEQENSNEGRTLQSHRNGSHENSANNQDTSSEEEEEEEEPRLKYASLTKHLKQVYRNGDATSTFLVAGDKMVLRLCRGPCNY